MNRARKQMRIKYTTMKSAQYERKKNDRMVALKRARSERNISNARDYLAMANAISGKARIDSRKNIITRGVKAEYATDK